MYHFSTNASAIQSRAPAPGAPESPGRATIPPKDRGERTTPIHHPFTTPRRGEKGVVNKPRRKEWEIILPKQLSGRTVRQWRGEHNSMSARELAKALGYSRSYIKKVESGAIRASQKFIAAFDQLRSSAGEPLPEPDPPRSATSRYKLPARMIIEARPRRCRACRVWFIPKWDRQRTCADCKRTAQRAQAHRSARGKQAKRRAR